MTDVKLVNAKKLLTRAIEKLSGCGITGNAAIGIIECLLELAPDESTRPVWTPCDEELPESDGFYIATIRIDNVLQHREYEKRVEFDRGQWCGISSDMKVVAWREESPYNPNKAQEARADG